MFIQYTHDRSEGCRANEYRIMETIYDRQGGRMVSCTMLCKVTDSHTAPSKITNALNRIQGGWFENYTSHRQASSL